MRVEREINLARLRSVLNRRIRKQKMFAVFQGKEFIKRFRNHPLAHLDRQIINELSAKLELEVRFFKNTRDTTVQFDLRSNSYNKKLLRKGG